MVLGKPVVQISQQLHELLREVVRCGLAAIALEGEGRHRIGSGGATEREVDAVGEQPGQQAERLGDLERAVVGEHHAPAAHAYAGG